MSSDDLRLGFTPSGYQGAAQHSWLPRCDGFHPAGPCKNDAPREVTVSRHAFAGVTIGFHDGDGRALGPLCNVENTAVAHRFSVPEGAAYAVVRLRQLACICPCGPCNSTPASHCGIIGTGCPK